MRIVRDYAGKAEATTGLEYRFQAIASEYEGLIRRICFQYATDRMPIEDLCQDALINIWRGLGRFKGESEMSTWIYRIVINTCIASYRSSSRRPKTEPLSILLTDPSDPSGDEAERISLLHSILGKLPLVDRGIIMMWLDERSYSEIAEVTGISSTNVGVRIHRIKERMREIGQKLI